MLGCLDHDELNRCPEFKGIETMTAVADFAVTSLNRCPEFKGIETSRPSQGAGLGGIESMP